MADSAALPALISIVGVDGSGKTTLATSLMEDLHGKGQQAELVWSRFRNYVSKPLLALTRLTGHNYYRRVGTVLCGYHDFERLAGYRELFAICQAIDVNIAAYWRITRKLGPAKVLVCERGPWDSLVDVVADTGLEGLLSSRLGSLYPRQIKQGKVLLIDRATSLIRQCRPELEHDKKLEFRARMYRRLAAMHGWAVISNNASLAEAKSELARQLGLSMRG